MNATKFFSSKSRGEIEAFADTLIAKAPISALAALVSLERGDGFDSTMKAMMKAARREVDLGGTREPHPQGYDRPCSGVCGRHFNPSELGPGMVCTGCSLRIAEELGR